MIYLYNRVKNFSVLKLNYFIVIGVGAGEKGQAKIAHDSVGQRDKSLQNNAVGVISKAHK